MSETQSMLSTEEANPPQSVSGPRTPEIHYDRESEHLRVRNGSLDDATVGQLLGLRYVLTVEIVDLDIPEHCDLTFARLLKALNVNHIDYVGNAGMTKGTCDAIRCLDATLNVTLHGRIGLLSSLISAAPLHRLDIADTGAHTGDTWLFTPLRRRSVKLHELVCTPARGQASGKTLLVLPVDALTLVKGTFGKIAAHALALNLHITSLTLRSVPLRREWVRALLGMVALETLTIIDPRTVFIRSTPDIGKKMPALKIDQEWIDGTLKPVALRANIDVIFNA